MFCAFEMKLKFLILFQTLRLKIPGGSTEQNDDYFAVHHSTTKNDSRAKREAINYTNIDYHQILIVNQIVII
ncbi:hypothetical protein DERP_011183 [Dermatophagoides pteronyssinus]|uniref:Uncharacterized protein n=1 Tax=Dermatophagoides pteronyssinus TaxID=6956 RepID=A0ABQ8JCU6_DERPT|nr:hypothetical protein DERP_011183 [Dermatophagoides pteronyssinus]